MRRQSIFRLLLAVAVCTAVGPGFAQDPAYVDGGNHYDPARVSGGAGGYLPAPASAGGNGLGGLFGGGRPAQQDSAVQDVEALIKQLNTQMSEPRSSDPMQDYATSMQLKSEAEKLVREHWDALGPIARDQYARVYGQPAPGTPNSAMSDMLMQTMRMMNDGYAGNRGGYDAEAAMYARGQQDAYRTMQELEDLLMPVLSDIKRSLDAELQNAAMRRRR